jgi:hypothetical protein
MLHKFSIFALLLLTTLSLLAVDISGTVEYERVHPRHSNTSSRLNFANISTEPAKEVLVEAISSTGNVLASTFTNNQGFYKLNNLDSNRNIKIRVSAKMQKSNTWLVKVIDNSNGDALYVIEGKLINSGFTNSIRNLLASSNIKSSPPFAILDSIYQAMIKVHAVDSNVEFPEINLNWSVNNIKTGTYYDGLNNIILQGDQDGDSDEYDDHIIIHEWSHFFENHLSRADNLGGSHGTADHLDIRVAFGEGFGNALSAIVTDDPIYFDTLGDTGWNMNIEDAPHETPGWFSEASIQRILYDLYDKNNDSGDTLSLGFEPLYKILTQGQKTTPAFTSLFSFITELKKENPSSTSKIDSIVANENIATIEDIYGSNRISNLEESDLPLYRELTINQRLENICTTNNYGLNNKLNNHKYVRFTISENKTYPIKVEESNGRKSDPDYILFKTSPFEIYSTQESGKIAIEEQNIALIAGDYLLDISDANYKQKVCFNVSVGESTQGDTTTNGNNTNTINENENSSQSTSTNIGLSLPTNNFFLVFIFITILFGPLFFIRKEIKI